MYNLFGKQMLINFLSVSLFIMNEFFHNEKRSFEHVRERIDFNRILPNDK